LDIPNYALVRQLAGILFLLDALAFAPWAQVAIGPGYFRGGRARARIVPWILALWVAASLSLVSGVYPLAGGLILLVLFRHLHIHNRWKNLFRGGGAPGFMSHWLTLYLVFFELAAVLDASGALGQHVLTMLRIDFGVILMCSGAYKSLSGYLFGEGMEYGLANPLWGYWWRVVRRFPPRHLLFRLQDIGAATTQWVMGLCLLFEPTRAIGAVLCVGSFLYLLFTVRLGRLAMLMVIIPLFCLPDLGFTLIHRPDISPAPVATPALVLTLLHGLITAYLILLPAVKAMQYLNLFAGIPLPGPIQRALTTYANAVPIIMWRVFTPDVTNFFVRIYRIDETGAETPLLHEETTYAYRDLARWRSSMRFLHVAESIAITTIFTTLKYFRSQRPLFEAKLLEYAGTLGPDPARGRFRFQYVALIKGARQFEMLPIVNFRVDLATQRIEEETLVPDYAYDAPARHSHIKETLGYGNYVPKSAGGGR
jgi:hypothetical protein